MTHEAGDDSVAAPYSAAVDLAAHQRDRLLIDAGGIPGLDGGEVRLARLVARAGAPAMGLQKIRGRVQRVGGDFRDCRCRRPKWLFGMNWVWPTSPCIEPRWLARARRDRSIAAPRKGAR